MYVFMSIDIYMQIYMCGPSGCNGRERERYMHMYIYIYIHVHTLAHGCVCVYVRAGSRLRVCSTHSLIVIPVPCLPLSLSPLPGSWHALFLKLTGNISQARCPEPGRDYVPEVGDLQLAGQGLQ